MKSFKEDGKGGFRRGFGDDGKRGRKRGTHLENARRVSSDPIDIPKHLQELYENELH